MNHKRLGNHKRVIPAIEMMTKVTNNTYSHSFSQMHAHTPPSIS